MIFSKVQLHGYPHSSVLEHIQQPKDPSSPFALTVHARSQPQVAPDLLPLELPFLDVCWELLMCSVDWGRPTLSEEAREQLSWIGRVRINQPPVGRRAFLAEGTAKAKAQRRETLGHSPGAERKPLQNEPGWEQSRGRIWNMQGFEAGWGAEVFSEMNGRSLRILCRSKTGHDFPLSKVPDSFVETRSERGQKGEAGRQSRGYVHVSYFRSSWKFDLMGPALGGFLCVPAFLPRSSSYASIKKQLQGIVNNLFTCLSSR